MSGLESIKIGLKNGIILMKESTLKESLIWLQGVGIGSIDDVREYIDIYTQVKEGLNKYSSGNDTYRSLNKKLPELVCKEFNNSYYLLKTYLFENLTIRRFSSRATLEEILPTVDTYPARTKYVNEMANQINSINKIIHETCG